MRLFLALIGLTLIFLSNYKDHHVSESMTFSSTNANTETVIDDLQVDEGEAAEMRRLHADFEKYKQLAAKIRTKKNLTESNVSN